jgi:hypothetical protein
MSSSTVTVVVALYPLYVAVIVAEPLALAVTEPPDTDATAEFEDDHDADDVTVFDEVLVPFVKVM